MRERTAPTIVALHALHPMLRRGPAVTPMEIHRTRRLPLKTATVYRTTLQSYTLAEFLEEPLDLPPCRNPRTKIKAP